MALYQQAAFAAASLHPDIAPLPALDELVDGVFFGVQVEPDRDRRNRLTTFGMLLFDAKLRGREVLIDDWLSQLRQIALVGYVRFVETS